ncbi:MAG: PEP-CTERM sorting domain-containing protein [Terriglobia bacterium]
MKRIIALWAAVGVAIVLASGWAAADVLYSNFGSGLSFDTAISDSYFINRSPFEKVPGACPGGAACLPPTTIAVQFQPGVNSTFTGAQLALFSTSFNTGPNVLDVFLESDSGGAPGSIIAGFELSNLLISSPAVVQVGSTLAGETLIAGSSGNPLLAGGIPYWLVVNAPQPGTVAAWSWNPNCSFDIVSGAWVGCDVEASVTPGSASDLAFNDIPSPTDPWIQTFATPIPRPAFEIDGTPVVTPPPTVPEPASAFLLGTGLLALLFLSKRMRTVSAN